MSHRLLDPNLLRAFIAVAEHRSFTRAAASLHRTQSAVSTQIKRLEDHVGNRLVERSTTRVALTAAGETLVAYAARILALNGEALDRLGQHGAEGRVRLGVMDDYGTIVLPPLLRSFILDYPRVEITMETGLTSGMIERLGSDFDLVIAMHPRGETSGKLLCEEQTVWAASAGFRAAENDPLPVALYPDGCLFRKWALEALDSCGRAWRLAFVSHSLAAVEAIVAQGLAVTVAKKGVLPKTLTTLPQDMGLPDLPPSEIRIHSLSSAAPAAYLLSSHLQRSWPL